jgi:methionyl-tRNA formyltransferase
MNPWPMAWTEVVTGGVAKRVIVHRTGRVDATAPRPASSPAKPGEVVLADKTRVWIACGSGIVEALRVQLEGKKPVTGAEWFLGRGVREGDVLGGPTQLR